MVNYEKTVTFFNFNLLPSIFTLNVGKYFIKLANTDTDVNYTELREKF